MELNPTEMLNVLSGPVIDHRAPEGVAGLIRQRARAHPDRIACLDADRELSYAELEALSDRLADQLDEAGLPAGPVALRLPRGVDIAVAVLAVLKTGRPYLPLSMDDPAARIGVMASRALPVALIAAESPSSLDLPLFSVPRSAGGGRPERPLAAVADDDLAYVMFTSGSTGEPKGVQVGSAALCNRLLWMQRQYELSELDRVLQKTPYTFDVSGWEIFWPLISGACCVFAPDGAHRDPASVAGLIEQHQITTCHFVPSMLAEFLRLPELPPLTSLRLIFTSGEALSGGLAVRACQRLPGRLHNLYGPTEAAIDVTAWPVPPDIRADQVVLIGDPIDNAVLLVVDEHGWPVRAGEAGELWIGGVPVARGYAGRGDLTAAAFPQAFGQRWYRTGDLVRSTGSGLEFLGRADDQVKIDGVRVEPGEIEQVLSGLADVAHASVTAVRSAGSVRLVATVVPANDRAGAGLDEVALRRLASELLPPAFIPSGFMLAGELPVTSSGKQDRQVLRAMAQRWWDSGTREDGGGSDPVTAAWRAALPAEGHGPGGQPGQAGFLSAGGRSLDGVRLIARLRDELDVEVPLRLLLDHDANLADLRAFIATAPRLPKPPPRSVRAAASGAAESPLAPGQRRLWLINQLYQDTAAYNVVAALMLTGELDLAALASALDTVVSRHDLLRARVIEYPDQAEPVLSYAPAARFDLELRKIDEPLTDDRASEFAGQVAAVPVSDRTAPMARACLLSSTAGGRSCLVLVFSHLVADQQAIDVLLTEIAAVYSAASGGLPAELPPAPSHAEYARRAATASNDPGWAADLAYWRGRFKDAPAELLMPFRLSTGPVPDLRGSACSAGLDAGFTRDLQAWLRAAKATTASFFLSVFAFVLSAWSGQQTVTVGIPASRRRRLDEQALVGFLVDTLPIRLEVGGCAGFSELLGHARHRYVEALDHARPSFDELVDALDLPVRAGRNPLFQVWLNDLTEGGDAATFTGLRCEPMLPPVTGALFDLGLYVHRYRDGLTLRLVRSVAAYPEPVAQELLDQCVAVARQVVAAGQAPLALPAIDLVTPQYCGSPPAAGNEPPDPGPRAGVLAELGAVANSRPDQLAITTSGGAVRYGALWRAVAERAGELRSAGVRDGDVVEVRAERSAELPVAVLAGWQAGAAVALVDGSLPAARQQASRQAARPAARIAAGQVTALPQPADPAGPGGHAEPAIEPLSHVLFTSGTTGEPAAVAVPHGPLRDFLLWYTRQFEMTAADRFALIAGPGHDPVLRDMITPLWLGATLHIPPAGALADPAWLRAWLAAHQITVLHVTPALLEYLITAGGPPLPSLRLLVTGGAPLRYGLVRAARGLCQATVVNAYGSTETPQIVTWHVIDDEELACAADEQTVPIGTATPGHAVAVRTGAGRLAGVGQRGEIVVIGPNLAAGYLGDPGRDGFGHDHATGLPLFRTGDLGRLDPAGRIHLDGRSDRQIQFGGLRLELSEIEALALRHPGVRHAVAAVADSDLGPVLTLAAQPTADGAVTTEELRSHLRSLLPDAAVPTLIEFTDDFTLGPTLKLTRPQDGQPDANEARPASMLDWLHATVATAAGHHISADDNFLDAGLSSVLLLKLHAQLVTKLNRPFPVTTLFTYPTLRTLAAYLDGDQPHDMTSADRDIRTAHAGLLRREGQARRDIKRQLRDVDQRKGE